jgi:hypothetical protein
MVQESPLFGRWSDGKVDSLCPPATPIPLLLLCVLRYLGRGWTFDNLLENTGIGEEIVRVFFHKFIQFGSTVLYSRFVIAPMTAEEAFEHTGQ